jgi:ER-bound oxygenase mpaB/B'/Rubber oxygenase, catalytic domain
VPAPDDAALDRFRREIDPPADAVVAAIAARGAWRDFNRSLHLVAHNDSLLPASLPAEVHQFLLDHQRLPAWADLDRVRAGQDLFGRYGPWIALALHCASLPWCYAAVQGVKVLHLTERMHREPSRRILATAQFLVDVMAPGGFGSDGRGIRTTQKVRLVHASVRHHLLASGEWRDGWGAPVNQEDLAGTLLSFSWLVLEALQRLAIDLTPAEIDAYLHCWNIVGALLGVDERLLCHDYAEAARLGHAIDRRHFGPSLEGQLLTRALLDYLEEVIPGTLFDGIPSVMIHLLSDRVADHLDVPKADWSRLLLRPLSTVAALLDRAGDRSRLVARAGSVAGYRIIEGLTRRLGPGHLEVPEALRRRWAAGHPS